MKKVISIFSSLVLGFGTAMALNSEKITKQDGFKVVDSDNYIVSNIRDNKNNLEQYFVASSHYFGSELKNSSATTKDKNSNSLQQISYETKPNIFKNSDFVYLLSGESIRLKFDVNDVKSIKWYQIIPDTSKFYKNANFPWEKNAYQWVGFGKVDYKKVEITEFKNKKIVTINKNILDKYSPKNNPFYNTELGSFWFEVEAKLSNSKIVKSTGLEKNNSKGLSTKVFRISYISGYDYIGYLTSFFNVPGIFGAIPYQSKNYIGVDCADVLMATSSILNNKTLKDYNVAMLTVELPTKANFNIKNGKPSKILKWGKEFKKGDFVAIKYSANSQFAHIGALYKDANSNGILDEEDWIIHAGPNSLHVSKLDTNGIFDGFAKILKNKDMK